MLISTTTFVTWPVNCMQNVKLTPSDVRKCHSSSGYMSKVWRTDSILYNLKFYVFSKVGLKDQAYHTDHIYSFEGCVPRR